MSGVSSLKQKNNNNNKQINKWFFLLLKKIRKNQGVLVNNKD